MNRRGVTIAQELIERDAFDLHWDARLQGLQTGLDAVVIKLSVVGKQ
jgi:hypothetical protein